MDYVKAAQKLVDEHLTNVYDQWDAEAEGDTYEQHLAKIISETIFQIEEDCKKGALEEIEAGIQTVKVSRVGLEALEKINTEPAKHALKYLKPQQEVWEAGVVMLEKISQMPPEIIAESMASILAVRDAIESAALLAKLGRKKH